MPQSAKAVSLCSPIFGGGPEFRWRAAEARRNIGLLNAKSFGDGIAFSIMRMVKRFIHIEHRRIANIRAEHNRVPLISSFVFKGFGNFRFKSGQAALSICASKAVIKTGFLTQQSVKLRFNGTDGNKFAVFGFVSVIEMRRPVEHIGKRFVFPNLRRLHAEEHAHERGRAISHGAVNHLPFARFIGLHQCRANAHSKVKRPAAKIADQIERRHRLVFADGGQAPVKAI